MKIRHLAAMAFAVAVGFVQPAQAKDLIVATDTAFVPFEFKEGDKYVGFDIDLWDAIAKEIGVTYKLQPMDFNGIIPALQTKQVDAALAGITIKPERLRAIDFSDGYYDSGLMLMVPADSDIKGPEDLKARLAVKTGTSTADYAKENFKDTELRQFPISTMPTLSCRRAVWTPPCTTRPTCSTTSPPQAREKSKPLATS